MISPKQLKIINQQIVELYEIYHYNVYNTAHYYQRIYL